MPRARRYALGLSALAAAAAALPAAACEPPDDGGAGYRRLVARVKYLPEVEAWERTQAQSRAVVQYVLHLDSPQRLDGRCHWIVEVRSGERVWQRFLVSAEGSPPLEIAPPLSR